MKRIALFPGSFNPFTLGHKDIVDRTLTALADEVVIAIGRNSEKQGQPSVEARLEAIRRVYEGDERVKVEAYDGLTVDFAKARNVAFIVRGVRNLKDFEYERDIADVNHQLTGIETVLLYTRPQYAHISSSIVRELQSYNKDITDFLP